MSVRGHTNTAVLVTGIQKGAYVVNVAHIVLRLPCIADTSTHVYYPTLHILFPIAFKARLEPSGNSTVRFAAVDKVEVHLCGRVKLQNLHRQA